MTPAPPDPAAHPSTDLRLVWVWGADRNDLVDASTLTHLRIIKVSSDDFTLISVRTPGPSVDLAHGSRRDMLRSMANLTQTLAKAKPRDFYGYDPEAQAFAQTDSVGEALAYRLV